MIPQTIQAGPLHLRALILEGHYNFMIDNSILRFHTGEPENTTLNMV